MDHLAIAEAGEGRFASEDLEVPRKMGLRRTEEKSIPPKPSMQMHTHHAS
jgi:hypothetical protein